MREMSGMLAKTQRHKRPPQISPSREPKTYIARPKKQSEQQHGHSGPSDGGVGIVPTHDEPVAEHPLSEEFVEVLVAERPGKMRVVSMHSAQDERQGRQYLRQRRVLLVHPQIQPLQIAHPGANVRYFINRDRLLPRGAAGQQRHCGEEQRRGYEGLSGLLCRHFSLFIEGATFVGGHAQRRQPTPKGAPSYNAITTTSVNSWSYHRLVQLRLPRVSFFKDGDVGVTSLQRPKDSKADGSSNPLQDSSLCGVFSNGLGPKQLRTFSSESIDWFG